MITKENAKKIAEEYIKEKNIPHLKLLDDASKITLYENKQIVYGKREGEIANVFAYNYSALWTQEEKNMTVYIDADKGELLYIMTPHWYLDIEK